jgi:hypothetical protein
VESAAKAAQALLRFRDKSGVNQEVRLNCRTVSLKNRGLLALIMAHPVLLLAFVVILVTVGVACLFYPRQFLALNERLKGNWIKQAPRLMGPKQEIWNARITGVIAILMAAFICYAVLRNR